MHRLINLLREHFGQGLGMSEFKAELDALADEDRAYFANRFEIELGITVDPTSIHKVAPAAAAA